jgi:nicotinamidase-related amidase
MTCPRSATPPPATLRDLAGLTPPTIIDPVRAALVLIDLQALFMPGGALPLAGAEAALAQVRTLLDAAHAAGLAVFHLRHQVAGSPLFAPGAPGAALLLETGADEPVLAKSLNGPFAGTDLGQRLDAAGITQVVIAGFMTHLAVDTAGREAAMRGLAVTVASDACATRDLPGPDGGTIPAAIVHAAALAALADRFAWVAPVAVVAARLGPPVPRPPRDRLAEGRRLLARLDPGAEARLVDALGGTAADLARYAIEFPFGDLYRRPGLDLRARELATVAALTVQGHALPQLRMHVGAALAAGATAVEVEEVIMQMAAYGGFPTAINAALVARAVFEERGLR